MTSVKLVNLIVFLLVPRKFICAVRTLNRKSNIYALKILPATVAKPFQWYRDCYIRMGWIVDSSRDTIGNVH